MTTFEEVFDKLPANGWLTRPEARLLWDVAGNTAGPILEIGSYYGRSTVLLASLGRTVYAVDPFDGFDSDASGNEIYERLQANLQERGIENVTVCRESIEGWLPRSVGFAYLDGDHTYLGTVAQIKVALRCYPISICIHDYTSSEGGQKVAEAAGQAEERKLIRLVEMVETMAHYQIVRSNPWNPAR